MMVRSCSRASRVPVRRREAPLTRAARDRWGAPRVMGIRMLRRGLRAPDALIKAAYFMTHRGIFIWLGNTLDAVQTKTLPHVLGVRWQARAAFPALPGFLGQYHTALPRSRIMSKASMTMPFAAMWSVHRRQAASNALSAKP